MDTRWLACCCSNSTGLGQGLAFYDLQPEGITFDAPVTITVKADVTSLNERQREKVDVYRNEDTDGDAIPDTFVSLGATCMVLEDQIGTLTAHCEVQLSHFSEYSIVAPLDSDGDGVLDNFQGEEDACPLEDATGFDADSDGCIDTFSGLTELVGRLVTEGVISTTMQNSLLAKVQNAENSADRESLCAAVDQLEAFKSQVAAQAEKKISSEAATMIMEYADSLIGLQTSKLPDGTTCL